LKVSICVTVPVIGNRNGNILSGIADRVKHRFA